MIQVALICGGMLIVIIPLNVMQIRSPTQKQHASCVCTTTSCDVLQSRTSRLQLQTCRTTATIAVCKVDSMVAYLQFKSYATSYAGSVWNVIGKIFLKGQGDVDNERGITERSLSRPGTTTSKPEKCPYPEGLGGRLQQGETAVFAHWLLWMAARTRAP